MVRSLDFEIFRETRAAQRDGQDIVYRRFRSAADVVRAGRDSGPDEDQQRRSYVANVDEIPRRRKVAGVQRRSLCRRRGRLRRKSTADVAFVLPGADDVEDAREGDACRQTA
jgi:hypothetical protein